jgi:exopolysaccharide biosynthesis polyprenyl glycosylphosphotransferase
VIVNALSYFIIVMAIRVYAPVWPNACMAAAEMLATVLWVLIIKYINNIIFPPRKVLLIHGDYAYDDILSTITSKSDRYIIYEIVNISSLSEEELRAKIDGYESVMLTDLVAEERNDVLKYCYARSKRIYLFPKLTDIIVRSANDVHVGDMQIFLVRNYELSIDQRFIKRLGDIIVSGLIIILFGWLMLLIALLIKLEDGGSVFYRQERLTRGGKVFKIIKFRSMISNAEEQGARLSHRNDSRVTKVGRILRVSHLDELPQVFNVFIGDMSMVGPRPERAEIMRQYMENIPEFIYRLKVKGGITGYAQIHGKYNTTPYNKLRLDLIYIQNYSVWLDLKCLISTFKVIFRKETSEGIEEDRTTAL